MRYFSILPISSTSHQTSLILLLLHASLHGLSSSPPDARVSTAAVPHPRPPSPLQPATPLSPTPLPGGAAGAR
uniref:Uncharacterized protein n=1 Tax=Setaria viridis TaxID=4556 RepID=A0A4V6D5V2_SETVI|nr:hypothetical protein SEVIR_5G004266v2 [Setaria viridis]